MIFFEEIETYLTGKLLPTDYQNFESEMAKNADLHRAVAEQRQLLTWITEDKTLSQSPKQEAQSEASRLDLESYFLEELAKLPNAPVEMPQKGVYTEGSKIIHLNPKPEKKTNKIWWAAAASIAVISAASIWLYRSTETPQPIVVQTPIDTLINNVSTPEKPIAIQEKETPQYKTEKTPKTGISTPDNALKLPEEKISTIETQTSNAYILVIIESDVNKEKEQISEPSKGASSNAVSKEDQTLLYALEAISANKPTAAIEALKERNDEKARYYRALATLLMDKKKGKQALEALANDSELYLSNKIKALLKKL
jgi:hypothetical protein